MIILTTLTALTVLGIYLVVRKNLEDIGFPISLFAGSFLVIAIIALPVSYHSELAAIENYKVIKQTVEQSRNSDMSEFERANLTNRIIDVNTYIASAKYWNETIFDIYIPDELTELEYLK